MNKKEVVEVLKIVEAYYPGKLRVDDPGAMVNAWHRVLQDYEFSSIMNNLDAYAKNNKFVPAVADLIKPPKIEKDRYIPGPEETAAYLKEREELRIQVQNDPKTKEAREKARDEIRKILGIQPNQHWKG